MRKYFFILLFLLPVLASAQVTYRIDAIHGGGFYLVETTPAKQGDPASQPTEFPQRFNTKEQLFYYVENLHKEADASRKEAQRLLNKAPQVDSAAVKIQRVGEAFFAPKPPPVVTPTKPPKKKPKQ